MLAPKTDLFLAVPRLMFVCMRMNRLIGLILYHFAPESWFRAVVEVQNGLRALEETAGASKVELDIIVTKNPIHALI